MAYIKGALLGAGGGRAALVQNIKRGRQAPKLGNMIAKAGRHPRLPGPYHGDGGAHPHGFPGRPMRPSPAIPPGGFNVGTDFVPPSGFPNAAPPSGFGQSGEGWLSQVQNGGPDPYAEGPLGPGSPTSAVGPGRFGPRTQEMNPAVMALIQQIMAQMGGNPRSGSFF